MDTAGEVKFSQLARNVETVLGQPIQHFSLRHRKALRWGLASLAVISLAAAVLALFWGSILFYNHYYRFGPALAINDLPLPLLLVVGLSGVGLYATLRASAVWNKEIVLHTGGLACYTQHGLRLWRWEDIKSFQASLNRRLSLLVDAGTSHRYRLENVDGSWLVLDDSYEAVGKLGEIIRAHLFPLQLAKTWQAYQADQQVSFGPIMVNSTAGISIGKKTYPWGVVQNIKTSEGWLVLSVMDGSRSKTIRIPGAKLYNPDVLQAILTRVVSKGTF